MGKLKSYQEQVQEIVAKSINSIEEQHKVLMARPFELAEKIEAEAKALSFQSVLDMHNEAVANMYEALRSFNQRLGEVAGELIGRIEKDEVAAAAKPAAKKATAKKPAAKKVAEEATA